MDEGLLERLEAYAARGILAMHMPGHKRCAGAAGYLAGLGARLDITEIDGFDNLHAPEGILRDAMARAAALWGSGRAYFLVNGATGGILAGVRALTKRGDKVIVARNSHQAVYHSVELMELDAAYVLPAFDEVTGLPGSVTPESVEQVLRAHPDARLVIVTSPTYDGAVSDIASIARTAHARGVPLLVDEAHGAHLGFHPDFPGGAVRAGADIVVQSVHKTLPSLTQTAIAHAGGLADPDRFQAALDIFQTTSPSYLLLASIDGCVRLIEREGEGLFDAWAARLSSFEEAARALRRIALLGRGENDRSMFAFDRSKIVISTRGLNLTGPRLMDLLRTRHGIELEMAARDYALAMTGLTEPEGALEALAAALIEIDRECAPASALESNSAPFLPERALSIAQALLMEREAVPVSEAAGRVSAQYAWAYPPGIPLIAPGEVVDDRFLEEAARCLRARIALRGGPAEGLHWVVRGAQTVPLK